MVVFTTVEAGHAHNKAAIAQTRASQLAFQTEVRLNDYKTEQQLVKTNDTTTPLRT
jgi:hypothetical protein